MTEVFTELPKRGQLFRIGKYPDIGVEILGMSTYDGRISMAGYRCLLLCCNKPRVLLHNRLRARFVNIVTQCQSCAQRTLAGNIADPANATEHDWAQRDLDIMCDMIESGRPIYDVSRRLRIRVGPIRKKLQELALEKEDKSDAMRRRYAEATGINNYATATEHAMLETRERDRRRKRDEKYPAPPVVYWLKAAVRVQQRGGNR